LGITWGGLVSDRGHLKGQLRVLGSPSARHTKEPRTGGAPGGAGSPRTRFFLRKSLGTYLRVLKPDCGPPGPIGNILATTTTRYYTYTMPHATCHMPLECHMHYAHATPPATRATCHMAYLVACRLSLVAHIRIGAPQNTQFPARIFEPGPGFSSELRPPRGCCHQEPPR
jgi:hypothetical protein